MRILSCGGSLLVVLVTILAAFPVHGFVVGTSLDVRSSPTVSTRLLAYKATIRLVGHKQTESWIMEGCSMYEKRLRSAGWEISTIYHKTDRALVDGVTSDATRMPVVLLDIDEGKKYSSEALAKSVYEWIEQGGSRICFVIGGGMFM